MEIQTQWTDYYDDHKTDDDQYRVYDADETDKEIERLRKALDIYGEHRVGCEFILYSAKCTCGFEQALMEE